MAAARLGRRPVVEPGHLPSALLDQEEHWIDPQGYGHDIADMDEEFVTYVLDHLLGNARRIREMWSTEMRETYDTTQKARRWMLDRPAVVALMRQRVAEYDRRNKHNIESAFEEQSHDR